MFEEMRKLQKITKAKQLFDESILADRDFQRDAYEAFAFRDGKQWTEEEKALLAEEMRPCLTMNLIKASVDLVMGINEDIRVVYKAMPVEPSDDFLCEVLNDIAEWVIETANFEEEENTAFESSCISGRGWNAMDFNINPKKIQHINITNTSIPVHEVRKDPSSRKKNLSDAEFIFWDKWLSESEFIVKFPSLKKKVKSLKASRTDLHDPMTPTGNDQIFEDHYTSESDTSDYDYELDSHYYDRAKDMIRLIHMEYWEPYKRYYGFNPQTGKTEEFDKKDLKTLEAVFPAKFNTPFEYVTIWDRKVKWFQFIGNEVVYDGDSPLPYDGFSVVPCFAYSDVSGRTGDHFGIVHLMKDPQKEINKRWSQTLNLLNQQVQPGVYAESDAFVDQGQAEQSLKEAGSITWLQNGALTQRKFQERGLPNFPAAPMQLEQFSEVLLRKITGINPDLLGQDRGRQEAGVVIRLRQQQGLTLLRPLFIAYNRMKKENFKRLLSIIMKYMPDEQIQEIIGQGDRYAFQDNIIIDKKTQAVAPIRDLRSLKYNVTPEEAPGNKSSRVLELSVYMEMMQAGFPVDPRVVINKLDLPSSERQGWIEYIDGQQKAQMEAAKREYELKVAELKGKHGIEAQKTTTDAQIKAGKIRSQKNKDAAKMAMDSNKLADERRRVDLDFVARMAQVKAQEKIATQNKERANKNAP
jgi:hypothetical protein